MQETNWLQRSYNISTASFAVSECEPFLLSETVCQCLRLFYSFFIYFCDTGTSEHDCHIRYMVPVQQICEQGCCNRNKLPWEITRHTRDTLCTIYHVHHKGLAPQNIVPHPSIPRDPHRTTGILIHSYQRRWESWCVLHALAGSACVSCRFLWSPPASQKYAGWKIGCKLLLDTVWVRIWMSLRVMPAMD